MPDILVATDSQTVYQDLSSVLATSGTSLRWVRSGPEVRTEHDLRPVDLAVVDMQIGTMGGIAIALDLQLEADAGRLLPCPVLLVLDRRADVFLARRAGVSGWLIKPLDPIRVRRSAAAILAGGSWYDDTALPTPVTAPASVGGSGK